MQRRWVRWVSGAIEEGREAAREVGEGSEILGVHGWRKDKKKIIIPIGVGMSKQLAKIT